MNITRISTAGSVDDGKSTLIGRLLYDTKSLPKDIIEKTKNISSIEGSDIDFSLFTDGLVAEREQGITIDVAYIYFSTEQKKFIISDTPGHEQYTRNMITGSSLSDIAIVLLDARKGVVTQTKRHMFITHLMGIKTVIVAINKMDLIDYSEEKFNKIVSSFNSTFKNIKKSYTKTHFVPTSALSGINLTKTSNKIKWYNGNIIIDILNKHKREQVDKNKEFRMYVQYIIRPKKEQYHDFRGFTGIIQSGNIKVGDAITISPSGLSSVIKEIYHGNIKKTEVSLGSSVTICLEDEIDINRGCLITKKDEQPKPIKNFIADICWMDDYEMNINNRFILQCYSKNCLIKFSKINGVYNIDKLSLDKTEKKITLNTLANVEIKTSEPLFLESINKNRKNSQFILVDEQSNNTVAVGVVN